MTVGIVLTVIFILRYLRMTAFFDNMKNSLAYTVKNVCGN